MSHRNRLGIILGVMIFALLALAAVRQLDRTTVESMKYERMFPIMGTVAQLTFYAPSELSKQAGEQVQKAFDRTMELCNLRSPESELSQLNAEAYEKPFACSPELWFLLLESRKAHLFSEGLFDISTKPLMDLWGFYRKRNTVPSEQEIAEVMSKVGLDKVLFDDTERTVKFTVPGMAFDLGGIAKGYAVDRAVEAVAKLGIRCGVIDLGGNLRLLPKPPPGQEAYRIGIRNPAQKKELLNEVLELCNVSLSTSGNYERFVTLDGVRYGHIINPKTGRPTEKDGSVTVIAPSAMLADWLSTSIFLGDKNLADRAKSTFSGISTIITIPEPEIP